MASTQYKELVEKKTKKEKEKLESIKSMILMEGRTANKLKKVDLRQ